MAFGDGMTPPLTALLKSLEEGKFDKAIVLSVANRPEHFAHNEC